MWGSLISGVVSIFATWFGARRDVGNRNNTPEMVANEVAKDDAAAADKVAKGIAGANAGDKKSLEELQRETAE